VVEALQAAPKSFVLGARNLAYDYPTALSGLALHH
jgi:hypothetical protein